MRVLSRRNLSHLSRRCSPNSCLINRLQPLYLLFPTPVLRFQQLAASFPKTPGVGVPLRNLGDLCVSLPRVSKGALSFVFALVRSSWRFLCPPLTTFRMNTCKSVSKQSTLTTFRMNTYKKQGEGAPPPARQRRGRHGCEVVRAQPEMAVPQGGWATVE